MEQAARVGMLRREQDRVACAISTMRPAYIMATVSAISSSSERSCVMKMTEKPKSLAQPHNLRQDIALHDHVERGGRLVHDDNFWIERERHGDHGTLTHAAAQFMRIAMQAIWRNANQPQQL